MFGEGGGPKRAPSRWPFALRTLAAIKRLALNKLQYLNLYGIFIREIKVFVNVLA